MTGSTGRAGTTGTTSRPTGGLAVQSASPLSRSGPRDLALAWTHRDRLLAAARALVVALADGPRTRCLPGSRCTDGGHRDLCGLVRRLASVDEGPVPVLELDRARRQFEVALTDAVDAVRSCRQTDHGVHGCWFSAEPAHDGCGEVLHAAHRVG